MAKIAETPPVAAPGVGPLDGGEDLAALRKQAAKARRTVDASIAEAGERRLQAEIEELYAAEQWEEIAALYFNVRYGITGYKAFQLSDAQRKRLGASLALMMKILIQLDPKYLALLVFSVNFTTVIAEKETLWYLEQQKERGQPPRD